MEENNNTPNPENPIPSSAPNPGMAKKSAKAEEKKSSVDVVKIILIVLILGLTGGLGYLLMDQQKQIAIIVEKDAIIEADKAEIEKNLATIAQMEEEIAALKAKSDSLYMDNSLLVEKIASLEQDVARLKPLANQAVAFRRERDNIKSKFAGLQKEYDALKIERDELAVKNEGLEKDKVAMSDTLQSLKSVKVTLEEKVALASVLRTESANISALSTKGKEIKKMPYKGKSIDNLKVAFKLADNKVAEKGNKFFAMRLVEPDGSVLFDMSTGGGTFKSGDKEMFYTLSQEKMFDNSKQSISFVYKKGSPYKPGKHLVELYSDGEKIGETTFQVK